MLFSTRRPLFFPGIALLTLLAVLVLIALLSGCAGLNPFGAAKDLDQKAYATYGTFVIFEEQGAKLVADPTVPQSIKRAIAQADARAKPSADTLVTGIHQYETAQAAVKAGGSGAPNTLATVTANLNTWLQQARTDTAALVSAVKSAPSH